MLSSCPTMAADSWIARSAVFARFRRSPRLWKAVRWKCCLTAESAGARTLRRHWPWGVGLAWLAGRGAGLWQLVENRGWIGCSQFSAKSWKMYSYFWDDRASRQSTVPCSSQTRHGHQSVDERHLGPRAVD